MSDDNGTNVDAWADQLAGDLVAADIADAGRLHIPTLKAACRAMCERCDAGIDTDHWEGGEPCHLMVGRVRCFASPILRMIEEEKGASDATE